MAKSSTTKRKRTSSKKPKHPDLGSIVYHLVDNDGSISDYSDDLTVMINEMSRINGPNSGYSGKPCHIRKMVCTEVGTTKPVIQQDNLIWYK